MTGVLGMSRAKVATKMAEKRKSSQPTEKQPLEDFVDSESHW
jgi:hypothetical protein